MPGQQGHAVLMPALPLLGLQLGEATVTRSRPWGRAAPGRAMWRLSDQTGREASPSKPLRSHAHGLCPRCLGSRQWDLDCTCSKGYLNCKYTVHACRICDAKTQTVKTELNKRLPSTAICNGSFAVSRVPPGGADGATSTGRSPPPRATTGSVQPSTKWPCPQKCSFPGKPSTVRARRLHVRLAQPQPRPKWSPGADSLCCVTTPRDKREQSDSSVSVQSARSRTTGRHGGACLPSSEPKPTHRPQQHPKRSLSQPFPPPWKPLLKIINWSEDTEAHPEGQKVLLASEHCMPSPSDGGSAPTAELSRPAHPTPASLPTPVLTRRQPAFNPGC